MVGQGFKSIGFTLTLDFTLYIVFRPEGEKRYTGEVKYHVAVRPERVEGQATTDLAKALK